MSVAGLSRKVTPKMNLVIRLQLTFVACLVSFFALSHAGAAERPNVVWIVVDDMSPNFSCYGETVIQTPHVDRLAAEGVRFTRAYATSPVCSTFRSALITGMYQTSTGTHHHRSGRGEHHISLPAGLKPVPELFQEAGYYTCIGSGLLDIDYRSQPFTDRSRERMGKTDYNFDWKRSIYDGNDWSGRRDGQPFFMQVQLHGGKLRGASEEGYVAFRRQAHNLLGSVTDPSVVVLPPYYPEDQILLEDWALYLDSVRVTDFHVGRVLERLEAEGLLENTLVVFFTDHGISHARGKQFLYDEGTHIPLVVRGLEPSHATFNKSRQDSFKNSRNITELDTFFGPTSVNVYVLTVLSSRHFIFIALHLIFCFKHVDIIRFGTVIVCFPHPFFEY